MNKYISINKKWILSLVVLIIVFTLTACGGGSKKNSGPEGTFENTQVNQDNGEGFQPVDEFNGYGRMIFNGDGSGRWEYALETEIEWKLKGKKLTIIERFVDAEYGDQEETYKGTWDGEKVIVEIWGYQYLFEKTAGSSTADAPEKTTATNNSVDTALVGTYKCTGSDMQGTKLDASGEWLELNADGTGKWFLGITEDNFEWSLDGNKINFDVEVVGQEATLQYEATVEGDEIILDTGMLYYFTQGAGDTKEKVQEVDGESTEDFLEGSAVGNHLAWGYRPSESITEPSIWYGVAQFTDVEGFNFEEIEYDIWGEISTYEGQPYIELFMDMDHQTYPILSMFINGEETAWLTPIIREEDAWITLDPNSGRQQNLNKDDEWGLLTEYKEGALDIYHTYTDDEGGYAECRFFIREDGTAWNEASDPLPPRYEAYKEIFSSVIQDE